jgi:hypothetical protein
MLKLRVFMPSRVSSVLSPGAVQQLDRESAHDHSGVHVCKNPSNGEMTAAIIRLTDAFCEIHERPEAQVSLLIRGPSAEVVHWHGRVGGDRHAHLHAADERWIRRLRIHADRRTGIGGTGNPGGAPDALRTGSPQMRFSSFISQDSVTFSRHPTWIRTCRSARSESLMSRA